MSDKRKIYVLLLIIAGTIFIAYNLDNSIKLDSYIGAAVSQTTPSDATVGAYFAIASSDNLTQGITFESIVSLPATDVNATANYNNSNQTGYFVTVSSDSNVNVDFCFKADSAFNTEGGDEIGLGNWTYSQNATNNLTIPNLNAAVEIRLNYSNGTTGVSPSNSNYYRFWLDIPAAQAAGTYNNTVTFKAVQTGNSC